MATRRYRKSKPSASKSDAPELVLRRYRQIPTEPTTLEVVTAGILENGQRLPDVATIERMERLLGQAQNAIEKISEITQPFHGDAANVLGGIAVMKQNLDRLRALRQAQRNGRDGRPRQRGRNLNIHLHHAIRTVANELGASAPKFLPAGVVPVPADRLPAAVGEFVAAVVYTEKIDRSSWSSLKKNYEKQARELLCATGNRPQRVKHLN